MSGIPPPPSILGAQTSPQATFATHFLIHIPLHKKVLKSATISFNTLLGEMKILLQ